MKNIQIKYVSFEKRLVASLIDLISFIIISTVIFLIEFQILIIFNQDFDISNPKYFYLIFKMMAVTSIFVIVSYFSILESSMLHGGVGKIILKIRVVDDCGRRLKFSKALFRALLKCVTIGASFMYLTILFNKKRKTYYDYLLGTAVIEKQKE